MCCSQFVVDRETIRQRPKAFYQAAMAYMQNNTLHGFRHVDKNFILGDVFTIMWPVRAPLTSGIGRLSSVCRFGCVVWCRMLSERARMLVAVQPAELACSVFVCFCAYKYDTGQSQPQIHLQQCCTHTLQIRRSPS